MQFRIWSHVVKYSGKQSPPSHNYLDAHMRHLGPLVLTKTLGNFNDNAFKAVVTFVALSEEQDPGRRAAIIAIGSMLFMFPYLLLPTVAGWVGDRFNKKRVLVIAKIAELAIMLYACMCFMQLNAWGWTPLLLGLFLMATQSTFFTPAFLGILPETFEERELPEANGVTELMAFLGIILGTGSGAIVAWVDPKAGSTQGLILGLYFITLAVAGLYTSTLIHNTRSPSTPERFGLQMLNYFKDLPLATKSRPIFLCILGHAVVMAVGTLVLTSLFAFGRDQLGLGPRGIAILQVAGALGIGFGSFTAGKFSRGHAEFGLVPIGCWGTFVFVLYLKWVEAFLPALLIVVAIGFFIGIFSLPMMVYLQDRTEKEVRGKTLATMNAIAFWAMFAVSASMFYLTGGSSVVTGKVPPTAEVTPEGPKATIHLGDGQASETKQSPVRYVVHFEQPVSGLVARDLIWTGEGKQPATVTVTPINLAADDGPGQVIFTETYLVAASGMSSDGPISFVVPDGAALDIKGRGNQSGSSPTVVYQMDWLDRLRANCQAKTMRDLYFYCAIGLLLTSTYAFWLLPDFLTRMLLMLLTRLIYAMRVDGRDNLPTRGGVLLVANHVSYVDGFIIAAASSRPVRFLVAESFLKTPLRARLGAWAGLIPNPGDDISQISESTQQTVRELLANGEVVCVFPEGNISNNSAMGEFKDEFTKLLPKDSPVQMIPVHVGLMWGSIFSRRFEELKVRRPKALPYPVTVSFGLPIPNDLPVSRVRMAVAELATQAYQQPAPGEKVFPEQAIIQLRANKKRVQFQDSSGNGSNNGMLLTKALALSSVLRQDANRKETHVGLFLPPSTGALTAGLATMFANRIPVFLNFTASQEALDHAIQACRITRILTSRKFVEAAELESRPEFVFLEDLAPKISSNDRLRAALAARFMPASMARKRLFPDYGRSVTSPATVLFSSGSTGRPKGVVLSHHNLTSNCDAVAGMFIVTSNDSILGALPFFHSFGLMATFWLPILHNVNVVYHPNPTDAAGVGDAMSSFGCTALFATPTFLQLYVRKCKAEQMPKLRVVVTGAEKLHSKVAKRFADKFSIMPIEGYGCTELSPVVSINVPDSVHDIGKAAGPEDCVGLAIPGVSVKLVEPQSLADLDEGQEGLLLVSGPNVMQGYLGDATQTDEVLRNGWYNTGDMAMIDQQGYIRITGRISRFSKIAGEMIPHGAIEDAIHDLLDTPETKVVVSAVPDAARGERLLILHLPLAMDPSAIIQGLRDKGLPNLWIPKPGDFHELESIPVLGSGKVDLKAIRELAKSFA